MDFDEGLGGACCTLAPKEARVRRSRWPERWLSSLIECGSMQPNSDGGRRRKNAIAILKDARRGPCRWSSSRPPPGAADYAEELEPTIRSRASGPRGLGTCPTAEQQRDLWRIGHGRGSTVVTSQLPNEHLSSIASCTGTLATRYCPQPAQCS